MGRWMEIKYLVSCLIACSIQFVFMPEHKFAVVINVTTVKRSIGYEQQTSMDLFVLHLCTLRTHTAQRTECALCREYSFGFSTWFEICCQIKLTSSWTETKNVCEWMNEYIFVHTQKQTKYTPLWMICGFCQICCFSASELQHNGA